MRSDMPGIEWPPVSRGQSAVLAAMLRQLDDSQWMTHESLVAMQYRQLGHLAAHCQKYSPRFRARLRRAGLKPDDLASPAGLRRLPVLHRRQLQRAKDLYCDVLPTGHMPVFETRTSGSTGEPVVVRRTAISSLDWSALTLREYFWHKRDFRKSACAIRPTFDAPTRREDWGPPASLLFDTGPSLGIPITADIDLQIEWIGEFGPDFLAVYPSNLAALARQWRRERRRAAQSAPDLHHRRNPFPPVARGSPPGLQCKHHRLLFVAGSRLHGVRMPRERPLVPAGADCRRCGASTGASGT
jgi:phenylacetate-CoA ligase